MTNNARQCVREALDYAALRLMAPGASRIVVRLALVHAIDRLSRLTNCYLDPDIRVAVHHARWRLRAAFSAVTDVEQSTTAPLRLACEGLEWAVQEMEQRGDARR